MAFQNFNKCTATSKTTGRPCKNPAVKGWNVCRHHGAGGGRPVVSGRYSKYASIGLREKIESAEQSETLSLVDELNVQRGLFAQYLHQLEQSGLSGFSADDINRLMDWSDSIGRMVKRIVDLRNETALTEAEIILLRTRIIDAVVKYIDSPEKRRAFIAEIFGISEPIRIGEPAQRSSD